MNKNLSILIAIMILSAACLSGRTTQAKTYYKWTDKTGRVHLTDHQPSSGEAASVKEVEGKERAPESPRGLFGSQKMGVGDVDLLSLLERLKGIVPDELSVGDTSALAVVAQFLFMLLFFNLCLYLIARRTHVSYAWLSWIPLASVFPFVGAAGYSWYIGLFVIVTPILALALAFYIHSVVFVVVDVSVAVLALIVFNIICWMRICANLRSSKWLGLLTIVPYIQLLIFPYLAFKEQPVIKGVYRLRPTVITLIVWVSCVAAFAMLSPGLSNAPLFQALK